MVNHARMAVASTALAKSLAADGYALLVRSAMSAKLSAAFRSWLSDDEFRQGACNACRIDYYPIRAPSIIIGMYGDEFVSGITRFT